VRNVNWTFTAPVRLGDTITGRVEVRADKPITKLHTTVTRDDGTVVGGHCSVLHHDYTTHRGAP
jgi:acyl dehydratase